MYISEEIIIFFKDNKPHLLDIKNKEEYEIDDSSLFKSFADFIDGKYSSISEFKDLVDNSIIVPASERFKKSKFGNDFLDIFHAGCVDIFSELRKVDPIEFSDLYAQSARIVREQPIPARKTISDFSKNAIIELPTPSMSKLEAVSLFDAFDRRKTVRQFNPTTVTKQSFSNLIFTGFGYFHQHKSSEKEYKEFKRRASPSGGCLQAIEPYILVFDVEGIAPGIYWYDAEHHALCLMDNEVSYEQVSDMLASQFFSNDCSFSVFLTANLEIFTWKYRTTRSYRVVNLEVGHFSQTLQLAAVSEGLNTWITGAFDDELIEKCLGLEETKNIPLFYLAFGKGVYRAMNPLLDERREQYLKDHPNIGR